MTKQGQQKMAGRRTFRRNTVYVAALWVALASVVPIAAQEQHTRFFRDITLGSGAHFQRWSGEGDLSIREVSIPLVFIFPVSKKLSLDVVTGSGFASLDRGASSSLNGLTDTKIRGSYIVGEELALITAGVSTPTGKTELDSDEQSVSRFLSQNALRFRTPNFGQGLDINLGIATARKVGESVVGLGVGYLIKGEFTPNDGGTKYTPGSELSVTAGIDRKVMDGDGKVTLDAVVTVYSEDERAGARAFQSGTKVLLQGIGAFRSSGLDWRIYAIERIKAQSTSYSATGETDLDNGNQLEAGVSVLTRRSSTVNWRGLADIKLYTAGDAFARGGGVRKAGEAKIFAVGPGLRYRLSPGGVLDLNVQYATGSIDGDSVKGIDINGSIWIRF